MKIAVGFVLMLFAAFAQAQQCGTYTGAEFINGFGPPDKGAVSNKTLTSLYRLKVPLLR